LKCAAPNHGKLTKYYTKFHQYDYLTHKYEAPLYEEAHATDPPASEIKN